MVSDKTKIQKNVTRGFGLLEGFLSEKRVSMANALINQNLRGGAILDIGCGQTPNFLVNTQFKEKFGVDQIKSYIRDNIELKECLIGQDEVPFEDNFFDVVTMLALIEHIEPDRLGELFRDAHRVLKSGGQLILTTPCPWSKGILWCMTKLKLVSSEEIKDHKRLYNLTELGDYLKKYGFRIKRRGYFEFYLNSYICAEKL